MNDTTFCLIQFKRFSEYLEKIKNINILFNKQEKLIFE